MNLSSGMRILKPECIETHLMSPVDDRYCDEEKKPVKLEKSCNMKKCPPEYVDIYCDFNSYIRFC